ncbi:hypothetical protein D3C80_2117010 [compost metagenome]
MPGARFNGLLLLLAVSALSAIAVNEADSVAVSKSSGSAHLNLDMVPFLGNAMDASSDMCPGG